jgi:predicted outer membrane repeat protein
MRLSRVPCRFPVSAAPLLVLLVLAGCKGGTDAQDSAACPETTWSDVDQDGYVSPSGGADCAATAEDDCDDGDLNVHPGAAEVPGNGQDDDCDGEIDEGATNSSTDDDGDGYSVDEGDCDDTSSAVNPGATEIPYNGLDDDCKDGDLVDVDGDGHNASSAGGDDPDDTDASIYLGSPAYDDDGDGYSDEDGDCDDGDVSAYPGAVEQYDGVDNDCDGDVDEDLVWRQDCDGDGVGDSAHATTSPATWSPPSAGCTLISAAAGADCKDNNAAIHPNADEICDGIDNDCDSLTDDDDPGLELSTTLSWFADHDGDGHGNYTDPSDLMWACEAPSGYVESVDDCDDRNPVVYPGAAEVCDGEQNDCTASSWTTADEYGLVTFISSSGSVIDYSSAPSSITLAADGALNFCANGGATTWATNITVNAGKVVTLQGFFDGNDALAREYVILSAAASGVPLIWGLTGADLNVQNLTVADGYSSTGGGLWSEKGDVIITNVTFDGNTAENYGSAVYVLSGALTMNDVEVKNGNPTRVVRAYGAVEVNSGVATLSDVTIRDNYVESALFVSQGSVTVTDSVISGHAEGSGVRLNLYGSGGTLSMTNTTITGNYLGLYLIGSGTVTLDSCSVSSNTGSYYGGGATVYSSTLNLINTEVSNNTAFHHGGGLYVSSGTVTADANSVIQDNYANHGGGVYTVGTSSSVSLNGASILDNLAGLGGGIYLKGGTVSCDGGLVRGNAAPSDGDGAYLELGTLDSVNCVWDADQIIYAGSTDYVPTTLPNPFTCDSTGCF